MGSLDFTHQALRTRLVCKPSAARSLPSELAQLGCARPLLLTSKHMRAHSFYYELHLLLHDFSVAEFDDIPQHSDLSMISRIVEKMTVHKADSLVAIGGGSVSDSAKAAALLSAEEGNLHQLASRFIAPKTIVAPRFLRPKLPIVSIPTTASGAEVTPSFGIRAPEGEKLLFWDPQTASRVILLDAELNVSVPASIMLATGMNGLAHCLEGLYSSNRSPISTVLALDAIKRFDRALRAVAAAPSVMDHRADLLVAAHMSGMVLASARSCLHHAICHVIGATSGAPHGDANSVVLPHALRFNQVAAADLLRPVAAALNEGRAGAQSIAPDALPEWLESLQAECRLPTRLRDIGVSHDALHGIASRIMRERGLAFNPRVVQDPGEIQALLERAW